MSSEVGIYKRTILRKKRKQHAFDQLKVKFKKKGRKHANDQEKKVRHKSLDKEKSIKIFLFCFINFHP